jgi:hypothetical protein
VTLVVALRSGTRIVVMSDTAISNRDAAHPNVVPGRLKSIVLNRTLTVSYAGLSSQALDVIRFIRKRGYGATRAIEELLAASRQHQGELDFLLCSHEENESPRLVKIADSAVYEGASHYWIGNADSARALARYDSNYQHPGNAPDYQSSEEREFTHRFFEYVGQSCDPNVGGAIINCLCSDYGHCYQDHAGVHHWEPITIPDPTPPVVRASLHKSGRASFAYHVYCPAERGVALVGFYMEQPGIGYLHLPLEQDDPVQVSASSEAEFRRLVSAAASARSGA